MERKTVNRQTGSESRLKVKNSWSEEIKDFKSEIQNQQSAILLIHLGGLGDMCLSESTFLSLSRYFGGNIKALGYTRFLSLFDQYFAEIHRIESVKWLHLFSGYYPDIVYEQIIFIGKDREGSLRQRWQGFSKEPLIFIEMYPEPANSTKRGAVSVEDLELNAIRYTPNANRRYVEDYQLAQLAQYGIKAIKKEIEPKPLPRLILYPEAGFLKKKWPVKNFIELYHTLKSKGIDTYILEPLGLGLDIKEKIFFEELTEIQTFFQDGGIFVSNDSGMAHLAGMCGLFTITVFTDTDPIVWHPRGRHMTLEYDKEEINIPLMEAKIRETMENDRRVL